MITSVISSNSIMFFARGRPWHLAADHPSFAEVKAMLSSGSADEDKIVRLVDVRVAVSDATEGKARLTEEGLFFEGEKLSDGWQGAAFANPGALKALIISPGQRIRVEGDEDCPDGIYTVTDVDDTDFSKRIYIETEEDFLGYISNTSIKEIIKD
jgi:hypothetical protein